ncbi:uncharacterized protein TNCV_4894271 [Trichonephila clavipes]|nr:uncharacterized protein TNCV_4894271 [Trichonephila clavipes]
MITNFFIPKLNNHDVQELWFQQDGATCHTARATIDLLKDTFGDRLISRFGPVNWPPRSCDLTPLDYFLWGYVKSLVYADKPQTLDHLKDNIRRVIADIRPQMLEKVIENWTSRLDYIRASRGSPMPEIIFKIALKQPSWHDRHIRQASSATRLSQGRYTEGDRLTNTFTKVFCNRITNTYTDNEHIYGKRTHIRITNTFKKDFLCLDKEHIFGGDQGFTPEIMDEILTTARDLELEVNEDDIEELIMGHEDDLTTEGLKEILNEEHQETQRKASPSEQEEDKREIKNVLKKWADVRAMVLEWYPNQADVSRVGDLYNNNAINYFWKILKKREKQSTFYMFFNAP